MQSIFHLTCLALLVAGASACSTLADKSQSAQGTTTEIGQKVEGAVRRGLQAGSDGLGKAGRAIEGTADKTAKRLGLPGGSASPPTIAP